MTDRADDVNAGIKSTAILFGRFDLALIGLLQAAFLLLLTVALWQTPWVMQTQWAGWGIVALLLVLGGLFVWQYRLSQDRIAAHCFAAFLHNRWVGRITFLALLCLAWRA